MDELANELLGPVHIWFSVSVDLEEALETVTAIAVPSAPQARRTRQPPSCSIIASNESKVHTLGTMVTVIVHLL